MLISFLQRVKAKLSKSLNSSDKRAKIQDADFILALVQAVAAAQKNFSLSELRLSACKFLGVFIGTSAFNERLRTSSLQKHLLTLLDELIKHVADSNDANAIAGLANALGVKGIRGVDASMVSLWDGLSKYFKGTFTTAALKLHASVDLITGNYNWFSITPGASHDSTQFPGIDLNYLYLFDLGYWSKELFKRIDKQGAFFLSRIKSNAKIIVTDAVSGIGKSITGSNLLTFPIHRKRDKVIELQGYFKDDKERFPHRIIGVWNRKKHCYHWYITNLSAPKEVFKELYKLRWQIELNFKAAKSTLHFDTMPTTNPNTATSLVLVALINLLAVAAVKKSASIAINSHNKMPSIQRAAKIYREYAGKFFARVLIGRKITKKWVQDIQTIFAKLLRSSYDPNHEKRKTTAKRVSELCHE